MAEVGVASDNLGRKTKVIDQGFVNLGRRTETLISRAAISNFATLSSAMGMAEGQVGAFSSSLSMASMMLMNATNWVAGFSVALTATILILTQIDKAMTQHSKAYEEYSKKVKETKKEQELFNRDMEIAAGKREAEIGSFKKIIALLPAYLTAIQTFGMSFLISSAAIKQATQELTKELGDFGKIKSEDIKLLELENAVLKNESIPNLQALLDEHKKDLTNAEEKIAKYKGVIGKTAEYSEALKKQANALKEINRIESEIERKREEQKKKAIKGYETYGLPGLITPIIADPLSSLRKGVMATIPAIKELNDEGSLIGKWALDAKAKSEQFTNAVGGHIRILSSGFTDMIMGIEGAWKNMLESMASQLLSSVIWSAIMNILLPHAGIKGFGGWFKKALGFQTGSYYVPETRPAIVHKGETITPATEYHREIKQTQIIVIPQNMSDQEFKRKMKTLGVPELNRIFSLRQGTMR
ncbi:MAG: hypothetical protein ACOZAL_00620 [Patescibacteria group bacterium]